LVAAGDARGRLVVDVGYARQIAGCHQLGGVGTRNLHSRQERLASARRDAELVQQAPRAEVPCTALERSCGGCRGGFDLVQGRADSAPRLPASVAHALVPEVQPESLDELPYGGVARQDELGAHLDERAVFEPPRPHPPADAIARLEHHDLCAGPPQLVGGG